MPTTFLVLSIIGAVLILNAVRPVMIGPFAPLSFFPGWLTSELAPHLLVIHVIVVTVLVSLGAVEGTKGAVALGLCIFSAAGLVWMINQARRAGAVCDAALRAGLGDEYRNRIAPAFVDRHDDTAPWRWWALPFRFSHPDVTQVRNLRYADQGVKGLLDVYHHREKPSGAPVLLQIHGGGWVIGNKDQQAKPMMLHQSAKGWVCVSPNYRLSPRATFPDHLVDCKRVIAWIRENIAEYGGDPNCIFVTGGSAGGHLTALVGLTANDPEFQPGFEHVDTSMVAAVPYYGVYDFINEAGTWSGDQRAKYFLQRTVMKVSREENRHIWEMASPVCLARTDAPPFFVVHGHNDSLAPVKEARMFVERLRAKSESEVVYAELPGTQHAFEVFGSIRAAHVIRAVGRFLDVVYSSYLSERVEQ
ncbi:MAG: alpha/beta hydrolase [Actinobacteria bacterium]|nr:alpha/beta hydrolase [Actinomycetota bacterium]